MTVGGEDGYGDGTRAAHAGLPVAVPGRPFIPGPVLAAPYHLDPQTGPRQDLDGYGRTDNASWRGLEAAIADLESPGRAAECVAFASGMAAISATLFAVLRPGDTVVLPADGYYKTRAFAKGRLTPLGVTVLEVPTAGPYPSFDGVRLVLLESPANPGLDVCDIAAVCAEAHGSGALVAVDNTTATPLGQRPLALGADISVASGTKALTGHSDLLLGYVCTADTALATAARDWRADTGGIPGGFEAWLAHRSLATLDIRLARQTANATAIAAMLAEHPLVSSVRFPGRREDPSYDIATSQMRRVPGVVTFTLPSAAHVAAMLQSSRLVAASTSFGGVHSSADRREQWGDPVAPGLVRLSCGIEDATDLVVDLEAALDQAAQTA
ncbi:MAG TPA: cystathionine gamma-lyase [Micromonosporaceae bacterium]|jgi:cystathionine gamma-lyase